MPVVPEIVEVIRVIERGEQGPPGTPGGTRVDAIQFNTGAGIEVVQAEIAWNADEETLDLGLNGAVLQLGQEIHYHVRNNTASIITNGTVVMATGSIGASGRITIAPMDGTDPTNAKFLLGVATEDIGIGEDGKVTHFGKVRGIDTSIWSDGDVLWVSSTDAGELVNTMPTAPTIALATAFVINSHVTNGTLFVRAGVLDLNAFEPLKGGDDFYVTAADGTKLDGIEVGATTDQTNSEIKIAYEANINTNEFSDAEQTKLLGIEPSATADQTNAEIKIAYEANADTNEFSDAEQTKLLGIETGATTDQTNSEIKIAYELNTNTNAFTDGDESKLDGIEPSATADQTNSEIKIAYEANLDTNEFSDAEQTKLLGIETGATTDQTDAQIKTSYENNANTNAFTDGDESKLDGIEANATTDQTDAQIKTSYENNTNTNEFSDAEQTKLLGIETGAEVNNNQTKVSATDTTPDFLTSKVLGTALEIIVTKTGVGAETLVLSLVNPFTSADETKLDGIEANATTDQTDAQIKTSYENNTNTNAFTDGDELKLDGIEANATTDQTDAQIKTSYENNTNTNEFSDAEQTKLSGIETSATADQTNSEIKIAYEANLDTNEFSDAEQTKLSNIEALAEVNNNQTKVSATDTTPEFLASKVLGTALEIIVTKTGAGVETLVLSLVNPFTSADESKLDGIEPSATADQTNSEIKIAYELNADTNEFSDAEQTKLLGIETGAEVNQTNSEIKIAYEANLDTNEFSDAEQTKLSGIETSATADQSNGEIKTAYELNADTNAFTDTDQSKLGGIESNATIDQTDAEIKTAYENNTNTNEFSDTEQTKLSGIATGAEVNPALIGQVEAENGTNATERTWSSLRVAQAIAAQTPTIYSGRITSGGGGTSLPAGWSSVKNSTGEYTITHNLGTTSYLFVGTSSLVAITTLQYSSRDSNSIKARISTVSGTASDAEFSFILIPF